LSTEFDFEYKTINDPVHGSIKVSEIELDVINSISFQRLRGLKQLGLADLVFPGATHTRFAHSLGVLHIASGMIEAIESNYRKKHGVGEVLFDEEEKQKIRLAALLHDIGHLLLSHAMEQPIQRSRWRKKTGTIAVKTEESKKAARRCFGELDETANADLDEAFSHERLGLELLNSRTDLREILGELNAGNEIGKIITCELAKNFRYSQFISSSLDADRLDFLLRDSLAAGVSYGKIDLEYLLDNMNYDPGEEHFYVDFSGIHALEHFLMARFFLYNVTYHKTVMAFETLAKHAYYRMIQDKKLKVPCSMEELLTIASKDIEFLQFNDAYFWEKLVQWKPRAKLDRAVKKALLFRIPPSEFCTERALQDCSRRQREDPQFDILHGKFYDEKGFSRILREYDIDPKTLFLLNYTIKLEDPSSSGEDWDDKKEWALSRVFYDGKIQKLIDVKASILARLGQQNLRLRRLYCLPLDDKRPKRTSIRKALLALRS